MNFLKTNNITLNCKLSGDPTKPALVFINSLGTDLRIWDPIVPAFELDYRVIRYDKRGHGLSEAPSPPYQMRDFSIDLLGLLDQLGIETATLIGISVGGMIAQDFTAAYPDRVEQLVLCDTAAKIGTPEMWNQRIDTLREHGMPYLREAILSRWFAPYFSGNRPIDYIGYGHMLTRTPLDGYTGTCEAIRDADLTEGSKAIAQPTLVLCGADDTATTPTLVQGLADLVPNASYQAIPNAGHLPCIENPEAITTAIQSFFSG